MAVQFPAGTVPCRVHSGLGCDNHHVRARFDSVLVSNTIHARNHAFRDNGRGRPALAAIVACAGLSNTETRVTRPGAVPPPDSIEFAHFRPDKDTPTEWLTSTPGLMIWLWRWRLTGRSISGTGFT